LPDGSRRQLQQVADLKTAIAKADADRRAIDGDVRNIETDEQRNRQNIASLSSVSGQQQIVQDYAHKLADQETQISGLRARQTQVDQQKAKLQSDLDALIARLDF
jgi:chromosome segregation ATPase